MQTQKQSFFQLQDPAFHPPFDFNDKEYVRNNVPVSGITAVADSAARAVANLTQVQRDQLTFQWLFMVSLPHY